ncbi:uncharacterized protein LOC108632986 isoform X2 [Ceratina calcarata]|uniref:Uncharacterized protein LOC108632986 isoform X2 n=1 Tax=Ceratina calcarata TaxID=156304 RepID=A0AAJ7RWR2_9HYME|nr:uncharacterized protein LOC108632986 isoform X2 [Ceratina calcarata]
MDNTIPYDNKTFSDYRRSERQEMLIAAPLDLSFKKASTMSERKEMLIKMFFLLQEN